MCTCACMTVDGAGGCWAPITMTGAGREPWHEVPISCVPLQASAEKPCEGHLGTVTSRGLFHFQITPGWSRTGQGQGPWAHRPPSTRRWGSPTACLTLHTGWATLHLLLSVAHLVRHPHRPLCLLRVLPPDTLSASGPHPSPPPYLPGRAGGYLSEVCIYQCDCSLPLPPAPPRLMLMEASSASALRCACTSSGCF